jgi:hypothetical protein
MVNRLHEARTAVTRLGKDFRTGGRDLYRDVARFGRNVRRDTTKFGKSVRRDVGRLANVATRPPAPAPPRVRAAAKPRSAPPKKVAA